MTLVRLALVALMFALATAVNFQASDADIRNPERGMHWQREVDVSSTCTAAATYSWFAEQKSTIDKYTKATSGAKSCWQKPDDESAPYAQCNARGCQRPDCKSCTLCDSDAAKQADEELNALSSKKYACKALKSTELANDAAAQRSLVLRLYYLTDYKTRSLDDDFFFLFDQDMRQLRDAGHKAILRFAYSKAYSDTEIQAAGGNDATLAQVKTHIDNLAPHLRENGDVISHFQAGFVGPWGEWHSSSNCLEGNPAMSEIVGKIAAVVGPTTPIQLRNPIDKQTVSGHGITSAVQARLGLYNDCFLASDTDKGTYGRLATVCHDTNPSAFSQSCPTLNHETKCCCRPTNSSAVHSDKAAVADWASTGPQLVMGGETCATSAVATCPNALRDLARFRWTHLNAAYNLPVLNSWSQCMPEIQRKLGYRLVLESAKVTPKVKVGCALKLTLVLRNDGFAAPIRNRPIILSLSEGTPLPLPDVDLRTLGPGKHTIERHIAIPLSVSLGKHDLSLSLPDPNDKLAKRADYAIRLANTNIYDANTGRHKLNLKVNAIKNTAAQKIQAKIKKAAGNAKAVSKLNKKLNNLLRKCSTVRSTDEADVEDSDADDDSDGALSFASFFDSEDFEDNDVEDSDSEEEEDSDSVDWDAIFADGDDDE